MISLRTRDFAISLISTVLGVFIGLHVVEDRTRNMDMRQLRHREDTQRMIDGDTVTLTKASGDSVAVLRVNNAPRVQAICRDSVFYANSVTSTHRLCRDVFILDTSSHLEPR